MLALPAAAGAQGYPQVDERGVPETKTTCSELQRRPVEGDKQAISRLAPNPLANETWYVDDKRSRFGVKGFREPAFGEYLRSSGATKALWSKIAFQPRFFWFGRWSGDITTPGRGLDDLRTRVCTFIADAEREGAVPLMTTLRHQGRECHSRYKAGGVREDNASKRWFDTFAQAVGDSRAIIAFEPDSVGTVHCLAKSRRKARMDLLRYGIDALSKLPNATVYLEATASDWRPAHEVANKLRYIGIDKIRGFMLNVTHFDWTGANIKYGAKLSRLVGNKHFIISTNHSGRGPVHYRKRRSGRNRRIVVNCHPRKRGLGNYPSTNTAHPLVDAYMWISRPGYSRGSCNGGPKKEGVWWPARALELARFETQWVSKPRRTRFGFPMGRLDLAKAAGDQFER